MNTPEQTFFLIVRDTHNAGIQSGWSNQRVSDIILGAGLLLSTILSKKEGEDILQIVREFYNPASREFLIEVWDTIVEGEDGVTDLLKKLGIEVEK